MSRKFKTVRKFLEKKYPLKNAEPWDPTGVYNGNEESDVERILLAIDLTSEVYEYAMENKFDAIITHHPFIFNEDMDKEYSEAPYKKQLVTNISAININVMSMHTNFDVVDMSPWLMNYLGVKPMNIPGLKYGFGAKQKSNLETLNEKLSQLGASVFATNFGKEFNYQSFGILPGSGGPQEIIELHNAGVELIVTSDIKWSTWVMAKELGISLAQLSHGIEEVFVHSIHDTLTKKFPKLTVEKYILAKDVMGGY